MQSYLNVFMTTPASLQGFEKHSAFDKGFMETLEFQKNSPKNLRFSKRFCKTPAFHVVSVSYVSYPRIAVMIDCNKL